MAKLLLHLNLWPPRTVAALLNPFGLTARSAVIVKGVSGAAHFNREELRVLEMPAVNGTGTARSIARLYGSAATGGSEIGLSPSVVDALKKAAIPPTNGVRDKVMFVDSSFSLGFVKPAPLTVFGSSDSAFGTPGVGGSFGFADPDTGIGYGYVMNRLGFHPVSDPRELALRHVLFQDILKTRPQT